MRAGAQLTMPVSEDLRKNPVGTGGEPSLPFPVSRIPAVNVSQVPQRSPLRYPGGKTWLVPHIRAWLAETEPSLLIEPFAGGGIVSLTAVMEDLVERSIMIELDHDVAAFWHAALRHSDSLIDRVRNFRPTREQVGRLDTQEPLSIVDHGFRTLVLNRTRRSGILAPGASLIRRGENGKGILSRWYPDTLIKRLREIDRYADTITFCETDAMQILEPLLHGWARESAVFIDPPYTAGGKRAGARLYRHNTIDHEMLFEVLDRQGSNFLMTYDCAPEIINLVDRHKFSAVCIYMKNAHHNRLPELIITREPMFV